MENEKQELTNTNSNSTTIAGYTASRGIKPVIKHLEDSFSKAQKHLDGGTFEDLKMACVELIVSNAEARQMLNKLSV